MKIRRVLLHFFPRYAVGRMVIYGKLMRIDKPIGTLLLLWPTYWALWVASEGIPQADIFWAFTAGTFFMRSAGCVINDFADRNFDGSVERTKNRPFARGLVSKTEAILLTIILCLLAALCMTPLNLLTWGDERSRAVSGDDLSFYQTFFPLPQFYLGLAFSFGIPMAFAAVRSGVPSTAWLMFTANALWTLAYDTIYAMSDKEDDLKIGIKTSAITFGDHDISASMLCHFWFTALMAVLGVKIGATWPYWIMLPAVAWLQIGQYHAIKTRDRQTCFKVFLDNNHIGLLCFLGLSGHYLWTVAATRL